MLAVVFFFQHNIFNYIYLRKIIVIDKIYCIFNQDLFFPKNNHNLQKIVDFLIVADKMSLKQFNFLIKKKMVNKNKP